MGAACGCNEKPNLLDEIREFLNDLVIAKTSINEYQNNLSQAIKKGFSLNDTLFKERFLLPLLAVNNPKFKEIQPLVENFILELFDKNPVYILISLIFLSDTTNYKALRENYEDILYHTLPHNHTSLIKQKGQLRVLKKFIKFYVKLTTQFMINSTENFFVRSQEEKNEISDMKIIYGNLYINEFMKVLCKNEKEREFNLERFFYIQFEELKHHNIAIKIYEIFQLNLKNDLTLEKEIAELTDEFSEEDDDENREKTFSRAPDLLGNIGINSVDLSKTENNYTYEFDNSSKSSKFIAITDKKSEKKIPIQEVQEISIEEKNFINSLPKNKNENQNQLKTEELNIDDLDMDVVECQPPTQENVIEIDPILANKIGDLINKHARGYLYRKKFVQEIRPKMEAQDRKIQDYIITKFTSDKIKKAENQKILKFDIEGWKKYYSRNKEIEKINQDELIETRFSIFDNKEYYSGTLNKKNEKHGFGVSILRQGEKYQGYWYEDKYNGWGELIDKKGVVWYGQFSKGNIVKGEKLTLDGNYYFGDFINFEKNGTGREETEFYDYNGVFKNDKKHGKGKILMKLLKDSYEGEFLNDCITGKGEYYWANKNIYKGEFLNGKMNGKGINTWPDGTCYEGEYVNGIKEGFGKYTKPNGKIYEGGFKEGKPHGKGKLISNKGTIEVEYKMGKIIKDEK